MGEQIGLNFFDGEEGKKRRDEAMKRVVDNAGIDWKERATAMVRQNRGKRVTGEGVRLMCLAEGIRPHHPNAWGGLVGGLKACGLLEPTEEYVPMTDPRSNGRKTVVYVIK